MVTNEQLLDAALNYALAGFRVFPCHRGGKAPLTTNGVKDATSDINQIASWWKDKHPGANIGIACGQGLLVVDIDDLEQAVDLVSKLEETCNAVVATPNGIHYYFRSDKNYKNRVKFSPGCDVRSEGGYVIAPPSIQTESGAYEWAPDGLMDLKHINLIPEWLDKMLDAPVGASPIYNKIDGSDLVAVGGRNAYLTSVAGALQRRGLSSEAIYAAVQVENVEKLEVPLPENEVASIVKSVSRYAPSSPIDTNQITVHEEPTREKVRLVRASELSDAATAYLSDKEKVQGQPTGLEGLDSLLGGGKRLGEVTCTHAEGKTGKNTLWHFLMWMWLEQGIPIAYASRELNPEEEVLPNLRSIAFGENSWKAEMTDERKAKYKEKEKDWPLYFTEGYGHFPVEDIREWIRLGVEQGIQYFWFDHLHYIIEDPEDHKAASKLIKELKTLAKKHNIHIDIIIQPNKLMEGQRLSLGSIKGGSAMGQAIDNLLTLERVNYSDVKHITKLSLKAGRHKLARLGEIFLQYDPSTTRFGETEPVAATVVPPHGYSEEQLIDDSIPAFDRGRQSQYGFRSQF